MVGHCGGTGARGAVGTRVHPHARYARTVHLEDRELQAMRGDGVALLGHPPDRVEDRASDGVVVLVVDLAAEGVVEVLQRHGARHQRLPATRAHDVTGWGIELIIDLPHHLLHEILERGNARQGAVFVHHHCEVAAGPTEVHKEVIQGLGLRHALDVADQVADPGTCVTPGRGLEQLADVDDAADVVGVIPVHGVARVGVALHDRGRLRDGGGDGQQHNIRPGHHHLAHLGVGEVEHA